MCLCFRVLLIAFGVVHGFKVEDFPDTNGISLLSQESQRQYLLNMPLQLKTKSFGLLLK
jgi:hypothetical protein